jgi:hypothetical protein
MYTGILLAALYVPLVVTVFFINVIFYYSFEMFTGGTLCTASGHRVLY